jgi:hypothetical protein
MRKICYTILHSNHTEKSQLLTFPMPAYVTYTDRDNMTVFDSDRNCELASGAWRRVKEKTAVILPLAPSTWPLITTFHGISVVHLQIKSTANSAAMWKCKYHIPLMKVHKLWHLQMNNSAAWCIRFWNMWMSKWDNVGNTNNE